VIDALTNAAGSLMREEGEEDVYECTFARALAKLSERLAAGDPAVTWEYTPLEGGATHGPFTTAQMVQWRAGGYFVGAQAVLVRRVVAAGGGEGGAGEGGAGAGAAAGGAASSGADLSDLADDLADLDDDDEEEEEEEEGVAGATGAAAAAPASAPAWHRSDELDFAELLHAEL